MKDCSTSIAPFGAWCPWLLQLLLLMTSQATHGRDETLPNGISAGDVSTNSAVLWTRTLTPGAVQFQLSTNASLDPIALALGATAVDPTVPVKVFATNLLPRTVYYYQVTDASNAKLRGRFQTPAQPGANAGLAFGVSGDWRGELAPYSALANAATQGLAFFVKLGDTIYADVASPAVTNQQARTLAEFRTKHSEVYSSRFGANLLADLQATTAVFSVLDDHEVIDDFWGGAAPSTDPRFEPTGAFINDSALYQHGLQAFLEYNAIEEHYYDTPAEPRTHQKPDLYRYRTFGSDAALFLLDARSFRDAGLPNVTTINPADVSAFLARSFDLNPTNNQPTAPRTLLGRPQFERLKDDLLAAHQQGVTWKFILVPEPIQNLGVLAAADRYEGYAAERAELLAFLHTNEVRNVVFISADIHCFLVNNLTYQAAPGKAQIPTDMFEVVTGPVAYDAPFGPTALELADDFQVAPGISLLKLFLSNVGYPDLPSFRQALSTAEQDAAIIALIDSQLQLLGYNPIGLSNSPVQATLDLGAYYSLQTYGWTEFSIAVTNQLLTVTTYGIDYYRTNEVSSELLNRVPRVLSQFHVRPRGPSLDAVRRSGQVELSWSAPNFGLQSAADLGSASLWQDHAGPVEDVGKRKLVRVDAAGRQFFRLIRRQ
ncbi:MAG: alkaline phosphatase D family protein [Verrucomicrobiota bacterium]